MNGRFLRPLTVAAALGLVAAHTVRGADATRFGASMGAMQPFQGPRVVPNLALRAAPKTRAADHEATHEGKDYWKAKRDDALFEQTHESLPADLRRALAQAVYERRATRKREALANVGWRSLGPTTDAGRVRDYEFTPDGSKLYVATANGGIWLLTRQGGPGGDYVNPVPLTEDLPTLTFGAVAVAPSNPSIVYAATGEQAFYSGNVVAGFGTVRSTDGGVTWRFNTVSVSGRRTSALVPGEYSHDLSVNPTNANDVLLANENGIFRSTDGGANWVNKLAADDKYQRAGINLVRRSDNPNAIFAGLWGGLAGSFDGGNTWTVVFENLGEFLGVEATPIRSMVAVAPSNPNRIYWLVASSTPDGYSQLGVYRSDDGGQSFCPDGINSPTGVPCTGPPQAGQQGYPDIAGSQGWTFLSLAVDPTNPDRIVAGGLDTWRSENGGRTWTQMSQWTLEERHPQFCHADIDTLAFEPGRSTFWVGSDGGLFRSLDGKSFIWKNDGVVARMFSSLAQHPTDKYRLYAGTQDNGTNKLTANNPGAWKKIFYGDGYDCAVNPQNPSIVYATNYNDYTSRANDGAQGIESFSLTNCPDNFQTFDECPLPPVTSFRSRIALNPLNPNTLYAMTNRAYYTTDGASSHSDWKPIFRGYFCSDGYSQDTDCPAAQKNYAVNTSIGVKPGDGNRVAFGTRAGYVLYTLDGWDSGTLLGVGSQINAIVWDPTDPNAFYVALEAPADGHSIWRAGNLNGFAASSGSIQWTPADSGLQVAVQYAGGSMSYSLPVDSLAVSPNDPNLWFAGTKYGIYRSTNKGAAWSAFGDEFPASWVSAILFTNDGSLVRAATWGRGLWEVSPQGGAPPVGTAPTAAFHFSPTNPRPGQTVSFSDDSTGGASSWSWTFGDGGASTEQNPTHVYQGEGSFSAKLTASNSAGPSSVTKTVPVSFGSTGTGDSFTYLFPVVLTFGGAGGEQFTTEVSLTNRSARTLNLTFRVKGTFEASSTYSLPPGQQIFPDVFAFLKTQTGMSVPAGNVLGTLRIEVRNADNLSQFGALARVTTPPTAALALQGIKGRFGLSYPASPLGRDTKDEAIVFGLQDTSDPGQAGTRSNLACVNAGGGTGAAPLVLQVTYHDGCPGFDGDDCGTGVDSPLTDTFTLSRFAFDQKNRPLKSSGRFIRWGYATIRRVSGDDAFRCYGVLNDNINGDGAYVPAVGNDAPSATSDAMVPVILDLGARFKSEVTIANRTARPISALFAVIKSGDPLPEWGYINFPPGIQITAPDIGAVFREVGFTFPEGTVASLYMQFLEGEFDSQSDTQPTVPTSEGYFGVRTYAPGPNGSLFGLAYGYSPVGTAADTEAYIYGLQQTGVQSQSAGTRSNLAIVHALGGDIEPITLEITYYNAAGQELPPKDTKTLQPGEWYQYNAPLAARNATSGFVRVRRVAGNDQFIVYGVLNDQLNGDGSFVPMVVP